MHVSDIYEVTSHSLSVPTPILSAHVSCSQQFSTRCWANGAPMLGQRRRHWTNVRDPACANLECRSPNELIADLSTPAALKYYCTNCGDQTVFLNFKSSYMSSLFIYVLALSASFEHLCYGSIINILILQCGDRHYRRQVLRFKV